MQCYAYNPGLQTCMIEKKMHKYQAQIHTHFHHFTEIGQKRMELAHIKSELLTNPRKRTPGSLNPKKMSRGSITPDPPRSLCLQCSLFRKSVTIYPRSIDILHVLIRSCWSYYYRFLKCPLPPKTLHWNHTHSHPRYKVKRSVSWQRLDSGWEGRLRKG